MVLEIILIGLAFLVGASVGAATLWIALQQLQKRALRKVVDQMGTDPFAALGTMLEQLGGKKNA